MNKLPVDTFFLCANNESSVNAYLCKMVTVYQCEKFAKCVSYDFGKV